MLRITTGKAKNKRLKAPNIPNFRAVQEVAKSSIFSILEDKVINAECLDLFAGSGNLGLEALSRGALTCTFVDEHPEAIEVIQQNAANLGFSDLCEFHRKDVVKFAANIDQKYDLIFVDPFYNDTSHKFLVKNLAEIIKNDGRIIFLYGSELKLDTIIKDTNLVVLTTRRFGKSHFSVLGERVR